jgi:hypothetical protein
MSNLKFDPTCRCRFGRVKYYKVSDPKNSKTLNAFDAIPIDYAYVMAAKINRENGGRIYAYVETLHVGDIRSIPPIGDEYTSLP